MNKYSLEAEKFFVQLFEEGSISIGELILETNYSIFHLKDKDSTAELISYFNPENAREIALFDQKNRYRPLKASPNLKTGWKLCLKSISEILLALEYFYPAAVGLYLHYINSTLKISPLSDSLKRQSGMYEITQKLTQDQISEVMRETCNSEYGCLKTILWASDPFLPNNKFNLDHLAKNRIPILCRESCNFFIAEGRKKIKRDK